MWLPENLDNEIPTLIDDRHFEIAGINLSQSKLLEYAQLQFGKTAEKSGPHGSQIICFSDSNGNRLALQTTVVGFGYSFGKEISEIKSGVFSFPSCRL